jgi:hypothetical protein
VTLWLFALGGAALARSRSQVVSSVPVWTVGIRVAAIAACAAVAILPAKVAMSEAHFEKSVDALTVQDCRTGEREARDALGSFGDRAAPHHAIAYCRRLAGDWDGAARAMVGAVREDARDWELWRGLAIARASASEVVGRLGEAGSRSWVRRGRTATVAAPEIGDH